MFIEVKAGTIKIVHDLTVMLLVLIFNCFIIFVFILEVFTHFLNRESIILKVFFSLW